MSKNEAGVESSRISDSVKAAAEIVREQSERAEESLLAASIATMVIKAVFYRNGVRLLGIGLLLSLSVNLGFAATIWHLSAKVANGPKPEYFTTDHEGRITKVVPVGDAIMSTTQLNNWVARAISETLTFHFASYKTTLQRAIKDFWSDAGAVSLKKALKDSKVVKMVYESKGALKTTVTGPPNVRTKGFMGEARSWVIEVPVLLTFIRPDKRDLEKPFVALLKVSRVDTRVKPRGVAIHQVSFEEAR